jgi:phosphotransacetylase
MYKILFPEANNDYIKAATTLLKGEGICEPVLEESDMVVAGKKLSEGLADAMVAGIDFSSRDVILACRDQVGVAGQTDPSEKKTFSSLFVADFPDSRRYIISDGATCKNPTAEQLADIVILVNDAAAKILEETPRIAMLSFSTFGSGGKDPSMDKIAETIKLVRERRPEILVDGEMQLDAAIDERIGRKKAPESTIAGHANVLIVPDINSGNILYKSMEQFGNAQIAGPILLGFKKPVADLSRGSTVEDIEFTAECLNKLI